MSQHHIDPAAGIPVMRFCDRLDGYLSGVQAAVALAKQLRVQEAIDALPVPPAPEPTPPPAPQPAPEPPAPAPADQPRGD